MLSGRWPLLSWCLGRACYIRNASWTGRIHSLHVSRSGQNDGSCTLPIPFAAFAEVQLKVTRSSVAHSDIDAKATSDKFNTEEKTEALNTGGCPRLERLGQLEKFVDTQIETGSFLNNGNYQQTKSNTK